MFLLPLGVLMPSVAYTYGWVQLFRLCGIIPEPAGAADILRCVWTLAAWLWPLAALGIGLPLRRMDSQIQQQAILDGALWRITARQLIGPIVGSSAIIAMLAMQEFAVYERSGISVIATEIRTVFETGAMGLSSDSIAGVVAGTGRQGSGQADRAAAAVATAAPMLVLIGLLTLFGLWGIGRASAAETVESEGWPRALNAGRVSQAFTALLILVTLVLPTGAMIRSLGRPPDIGRTWEVLGPYASGSVLIGAIAGAASLGMAFLACVRRSGGLLSLAVICFLIGGELLAIALIRLYNRPAPWPFDVPVSGHDLLGWVYSSGSIMVLAFVGRFGWLSLLAGRATWSPAVRDLRHAAALDGAGPWRVAVHIVVPLAWPILLASAVLVMILSITEVPATVLLSPQRPPMLVPLLMGWVHMLRYDDMLEGSLLLMGVVFILGMGLVLLVVLGARLLRLVGRWALLVLSLAVMAGCGDTAQPDAIWCETGTGRGQLVYPRGAAYSPADDTYFVVDRMARVQRLDRFGQWLNEWRMPEFARGKPVGLSVGPDGNVYIADTHYARVMVYSPKGELIRHWGSEGQGPGQFIYPTDVAFDSAGNVYVSEYGDNDRIQVFDARGGYLRQFGRYGQGDGEFCRPESMVILDDILYVADACNHRIAVFALDGRFMRNMGRVGSELGQFRFPYGLDHDSRGRLVVCEFGNNRVQLVDRQTGRGLKAWGIPGREPGQLAYPWAVAVDRRDRVVVVDSGNNRLQVFTW